MMMYKFFRFQCCVLANRLILQLFTRLNGEEIRNKRKHSRTLRAELMKLAVMKLEITDSENNNNNNPQEQKDEDQCETIVDDEEIDENKSDSSEELYIPCNYFVPVTQNSLMNTNENDKKISLHETLTKKYSTLLYKRVPPREQVLAEYNVTLSRLGKGENKGKFLLLDHYIGICYKKAFNRVLLLVTIFEIEKVLENDNQHMLVLIIPSSTENRELHCIFDSYSDYCIVNSVLQNIYSNSMKNSNSNSNSNITNDFSNTTIDASNFFDDICFTEVEWEYFLSLMRNEKVESGKCLIKMGTTTQTVYQVLSGEFVIKNNLDSGASQPVIGVGSIIGDLTFLQGGICSADIIAISNCEVLCFDKSVIDSLTSQHYLLVGKFYRMLAAEMVSRFLQVQQRLLS